MAEGHGYAGEGDCLTTALVSTVARIFPETSFTEMFCPDWENNTIFLSHMGEINYRLISERPVLAEMEYSFSNTNNPAYVPGRFKPGKVVLFDIAPTGEGFRLILTPAEMLPVEGEDKFSGSIRGWVRPGPELPDFLEQYSWYGGTHHLGVSYDCPLEVLARFAYFMGWDVKIIE
jgi:L-arabinose isomerase